MISPSHSSQAATPKLKNKTNSQLSLLQVRSSWNIGTGELHAEGSLGSPLRRQTCKEVRAGWRQGRELARRKGNRDPCRSAGEFWVWDGFVEWSRIEAKVQTSASYWSQSAIRKGASGWAKQPSPVQKGHSSKTSTTDSPSSWGKVGRWLCDP